MSRSIAFWFGLFGSHFGLIVSLETSFAEDSWNFTEYEKSVEKINKDYAEYSCIRAYTSLTTVLNMSSSLKSAMLQNSLNCPTTSRKKRDVQELQEVEGATETTMLGNTKLFRKKRSTLTWRIPDGLPSGTSITLCNYESCCTPKKTLNADGTYYNLCKECVHQITLPSSFTPRQHFYITCQDDNFYESCFSGEGSCTTNMAAITVTNTNSNQQSTFLFGRSCSCEIRRDSIFADYI